MNQLERLTFEIENETALVGFGKYENKSLTTLDVISLKELDQLMDQIHSLAKSKKIKGVIFFSHKDGCFLAGADINMIASLKTTTAAVSGSEKGQLIFNKIEDLEILTVVCVDGVCLGGGLELSLACQAILASDENATKLALPEVKLGILPGFGGTYRLPKKVGLPNSLDMILTGKMLAAKKAKKIGLVYETYPKERLLEMAKKLVVTGLRKEKTTFKESLEKVASDNFIARKIIFQKARESVLKKTKGFYQAPLKILDVMETGAFKNRTSYLALEAQAFGELCLSPQGKNLQHIFFLHDNAKKKIDKKMAAPKLGAVLGAGTMGGGIAWLLADAGQRPIMKDINQRGLELGLKQASDNFMGAVKRKKLSEEDFNRKQRSIRPQLGYAGFKRVDLVIEAVLENMDVKKKVFKELENEVDDHCLLTSNTSSLSITEMASVLKKPERFAGLHFFNPVHQMPLVEIIRHPKVSNETIQRLVNWVHQVKKTPVVVNDGPGFLVNRILMPFINESVFLLSEGVSIDDLDKAVLNFGMPMGPCRLMDEVGLDVLVHVGHIMEKGLGARAKACALSQKVIDTGALGKKNRKGHYLYDEAGKVIEKNPDVLTLLPSQQKKMSEVDIQMRVFLPMINESARILDEKIAENAGDVDLGLIFGTGFPPFRGGLLRYADQEGLEKILKALEHLASTVNKDRYVPAEYLVNLVKEKRNFY